ncbi:MAG: type II secretion system protein GspG [Candidatus Latescibacterota bacterium]
MLKESGFTLLGMVVILAVLAILAAVAVPSIFRSVLLSRENTTQLELKEIEKAIMGVPKLRTYGYVGDMGRFPNTLEELNTQGAQPGWATSGNFLSVGMGWRGPYIDKDFTSDEYLQDDWNTPYVLTSTYYSGQDSTVARVQSCGPDKQPDTEDDYFSDVMILKGNIRLIVSLGMTDNVPRSVTTDLYYADDGEECTIPLHGDIVTLQGEHGFWSYVGIGPVHHGVHGLMVHVGAIIEVVILNVTGGIANECWVAIPVGGPGGGGKPTK